MQSSTLLAPPRGEQGLALNPSNRNTRISRTWYANNHPNTRLTHSDTSACQSAMFG